MELISDFNSLLLMSVSLALANKLPINSIPIGSLLASANESDIKSNELIACYYCSFSAVFNFWYADNMSLVVRKSVFGVSAQVGHKPGCTVTEDG